MRRTIRRLESTTAVQAFLVDIRKSCSELQQERQWEIMKSNRFQRSLQVQYAVTYSPNPGRWPHFERIEFCKAYDVSNQVLKHSTAQRCSATGSSSFVDDATFGGGL